MQVRTSHHVDAVERNADGGGDDGYEYDLLVFQEDNASLVARTYSDTPSEAHLLRAESDSQPRRLTPADLDGSLARQAIAHLRGLGKSEINWLGNEGYEPVPSQATDASCRPL